MAKTTKTKTSHEAAVAGLSRGEAKELVDDLLRDAFRSQARELEQHLKSIHVRLTALETRK